MEAVPEVKAPSADAKRKEAAPKPAEKAAAKDKKPEAAAKKESVKKEAAKKGEQKNGGNAAKTEQSDFSRLNIVVGKARVVRFASTLMALLCLTDCRVQEAR